MRSPLPRRRVLQTVLGTVAASAAVTLAAAACAGSRDVLSPRNAPQHKAIEAEKPVASVAADSTHRVAANPPGVRTLDPVHADEPVPGISLPKDGPRSSKPVVTDGPYFEFQVEKPVVPAPGNMGPRYPEELKNAKVEGTVVAQFVVDTTGQTIMSTFKVLSSDNEQFTQAVKTALADIKFVPAEVGGKKVKQLVQQPFMFSLTK